MMLIVLSNILLFSVRWFCDWWRQDRYADIMKRMLNTTSVLIQRCNAASHLRQETAGVLKASLPVQETELLVSPNHLLMKDDFLTMHEMKSWATVDVSRWVTYSYSRQPATQEMTLDLKSGTHCVLLEAVLGDHSQPAENDQPHSAYDISYHVLTFGTPVAWIAGERYALVLNCDSVDSLIRLVDAFGQQRLMVSEGLDVTSISTVNTTGYPQALSVSKEIFSPAAEKEDMSYESSSQSKEDLDKPDGVTSSDLQNKASATSEKHVNGDDASSQSDNKGTSTPKAKVRSKPPNILIYCGVKDTQRKFEEAVESIKGCVNTDSYTVYHLKQEHIFTSPWQENAAALIISSCQQLQADVKQKVCEYVFNHQGILFSFGSSADNLFANYLDVVKNEVNTNLTSFDYQDWKSVSSCCGPFVYSNCREYAQVVVPAPRKETDKDNNALVVKLNLEKGGNVILSQLFLEQDPVSQATDKDSFFLLKKSNTARLAVLRELLSMTGLDTRLASPPALTACHLMAHAQGVKENFLSSLKDKLKDGVLKSKTRNLVFLSSSDQAEVNPQVDSLPVLTDTAATGDPIQYFNMADYWKSLETKSLGQIVFYTDVITTTMTVFDGMLFSIPKEMSPVAIAGRQVSGKGRGGNAWLSPAGCAMFTFPLRIHLHSKLGQRISYLQHLIALSVVHGVTSIPGYQDVDLHLKWPNDIYSGKQMKVGGVLVMSSIMGDVIYVTIGCGVNVSNSDPTICINDLIQHRNASNPDLPPLAPLTTGQLIGRALTCLERLMEDFEDETKGPDHLSQLYYKFWLHGGARVKIDLEVKTEGEIVGLDEYGFMTVKTDDGNLISVQPDGNSFDMMHNLIYVKTK